MRYVEGKGVQTRMLFAGNLTKHPCFDEMRSTGTGYRIVGELANTDRIMSDTFWVGVYPGMTDEMIDHMAKTIVRQWAHSEKEYGKMKSDYDMSRVHEANLTILKEIDRICRKYNIRYMLDAGTYSAVRHKGFIPVG